MNVNSELRCLCFFFYLPTADDVGKEYYNLYNPYCMHYQLILDVKKEYCLDNNLDNEISFCTQSAWIRVNFAVKDLEVHKLMFLSVTVKL